jgi:hypothetical protein
MTPLSAHEPLPAHLERLGNQLTAAAETLNVRRRKRWRSELSPWRSVGGVLSRRSSGRSLAAAGVLVAAACAAVLIVLSAGSTPTLAQAFPILTRPGTVIPRAGLVSMLQSNGAGLSAAGFDVHQARAFQTPLGTGYVLTDKQQNLLCVAAPGLGHSGWGAGCGAVGDVQRDGTGDLLSYSAADPHQVSVVDILPTGTTATIREPGGQTRPLPLHDGVLAIIAPTPAQITTDIAGHATTIDIPPYQQAN